MSGPPGGEELGAGKPAGAKVASQCLVFPYLARLSTSLQICCIHAAHLTPLDHTGSPVLGCGNGLDLGLEAHSLLHFFKPQFPRQCEGDRMPASEGPCDNQVDNACGELRTVPAHSGQQMLMLSVIAFIVVIIRTLKIHTTLIFSLY